MLAQLAPHERLLLILVAGILILAGFVLLFTAAAINLRIKNMRTAARWAALEETWEPLLMEYFYGDERAEALWACVPSDVALHFVDFVLRYRRRLSGDETVKIEALAQPYLPRVAKRLKRRGAERRARAIQTLGELGLRDYAEEIAPYLDDPSPLVAMASARALANRELPQYTNAILSRMHRFTNWRQSFLSAMLAGIGPDAAPDLRAKFEDETASPGVRAIAAGALGQLNDFKAAAIAAQILEGDCDRDLAAGSLRLLGRVGRPEDVDLVRRLIASDDAVVRGAAAGALGRLGSSEDADVLRDAARSDPSHWVAITAARGLRELGGVKSLRELATSTHARAPLALQVLAEVGT